MARNLDLAALRSFIAIAECGGVTRAAQRLHLTQSGVSMQLKRLEESLGAQLCSREGRGVALTKCGEELLADARRLIALNDEILERMTTPDEQGELVLGMPHDIVYPLAPEVLKRFVADYPGVRVSLISPPTKELVRLYAEGSVDVIVTTEHGRSAGGETLMERRLVWVGAPGGRAWRRRPIPIAFEEVCAFRRLTFSALEEAGIAWDWTIDTGNTDALTASMAADLAICSLLEGFLPAGLEEIDHGGALPDLPPINVNLYVAGGPTAELATRLGAYVRNAAAALDGESRRAETNRDAA